MIPCSALLILTVFFSPSLFPQTARPSTIIINEILFNPARDGFDYVEIFNAGIEAVDLKDLQIAKRNVTNDITGSKPLTRTVSPLYPQHYAVVTGNEKWLRQHYRVGDDAVICQVASMPSFPDDRGSVLIFDARDSLVLDELNYEEKWHFALIASPSGVSLERISTGWPTQDRNNWTSASSTSGFGTPGYLNSQSVDQPPGTGELEILSPVFSPDNDGQDDFAAIVFHMQEAGYVANLMIYDYSGRRVRYLLKNEYLGFNAHYRWDGLDDQSRPLPEGIYFLFADLFNLRGKTNKCKKMVTLARRH